MWALDWNEDSVVSVTLRVLTLYFCRALILTFLWVVELTVLIPVGGQRVWALGFLAVPILRSNAEADRGREFGGFYHEIAVGGGLGDGTGERGD
jgi:hypothetical protein